MKRMIGWFVVVAVLAVMAPRDAAARPPRKGSGQITSQVTTVGTYIECDIWNKFDTRAHGLPRAAKTAADCFLTRFGATDASFPFDQDHVCIPFGEALVSTDGNYVCAAGTWVVHNTFTAMTKAGFPVCRYEAITDQDGNLLQLIDNTCGF